jgi:glutamyl-Q tRNA(Asp) synthetase
MSESRGRFAPSTTGRAHPGTLLAALLCWLDARSRGDEVLLRLEDLDRERTKPGYVEAMREDLAWFGLEWDAESRQSEQLRRYEARLDELATRGLVYACSCSRAEIRASGTLAPDGSHRYPGRCREHVVDAAGWRGADRALRLRLEAGRVDVADESGLDLDGDPEMLFGDPIIRRRDGAYAYHFCSVLDDAADRVDRVVRGRDLAPSSTLQEGLRVLMDLVQPSYCHHFLLLEASGGKFSKFHGAVDLGELARHSDAAELCGRLAGFAGLVPEGTRCRPADLVTEFDWSRVSRDDVALEWSASGGLARVESG